jgi:MoxR-like ATPase
MNIDIDQKQDSQNSILQVIDEVSKVIVGKEEVIKLTLSAMLASGHVLFEDIPGVGKTTLVKSLAKALQSAFGRVQFTPDLLPSDIIGVSIFDLKTQLFTFKKGPVFADIMLADEINRTTPKTQSALLEAMNEKQVTIDNQTYPLSEHFFVLATQNPIEYEGTYPLIEAQLDRFLFKLTFGYPTVEQEKTLLLNQEDEPYLAVKEVMSKQQITQLKKQVSAVFVHEDIASYIMDIVVATRNHEKIKLGVSPRGSLALIKAAKAYAIVSGRDYVSLDDVKALVIPTFSHRIILNNRYRQSFDQTDQVLMELLKSIKTPKISV